MITALDKNTALVLIDLQNGIVKYPVAHPINEILANAAQLVAAFRKARLPIVIVNVNPATSPVNLLRKDAQTAPIIFDEEQLKIAPEIKTEAGDIFITKNTWNAFTNPDLDLALKKNNITGIVLAGISTSVGVEGTARAASELGYNLAFVQDAMTDMAIDAHQYSLKYIFPRIGETGNTEQVIEKLIQN